MNPYKIGIALLGKGATNHLHRQEVVDAFNSRGIEVLFIVREDYLPLLKKLSGCSYTTCRFHNETGWLAFCRNLFRNTRRWYPSGDVAKTIMFKAINERNRRLWVRLLDLFIYLLARYRFMMRLMVVIEGWLYRSKTVQGIDPSMFDQLLLLGFGAYGSELEGVLTWWAYRNGIPVVHTVGNYDQLLTKGFHGVPINRLLVWGESMYQDACQLQGIQEDKIVTIGSIRYDNAKKMICYDKKTFLSSCGLDPGKKTLLFAGSVHEYQYAEMLHIFKHLNKDSDDYQLILRIYPNKVLMNSPYMELLIAYASSTPGIYVSLADPYYYSGVRDREVLQIEEFELWHSLAYCDVVINFFSTIALEACMFDKPVINMLYFPEQGKMMLKPPVYMNPIYFRHIRKLIPFGAMGIAYSREDLLNMVKKAIQQPDLLKGERKKLFEYECGVIDGRACERLVQACIDAINHR